MVHRDLKEIRASGKLRVLLRNGSSSYHILRGQEYGFEYELAARFGRELGVQIEVVLPDSQTSVRSQLNAGEADLIAMPLDAPIEGPSFVTYTKPYHDLSGVVVTHEALADTLDTVECLDGMMVATRHGSREESLLLELRKSGHDIGVVMFGPNTSEEELLELVADGTYEAAVAPSDLAHNVASYRPELRVAVELDRPQPVSWAVRQNSPELAAAVNVFLGAHRKVREDGVIARSRFYNILRNKYFADSHLIKSRAEDPFHLARTGRLSPFDELFAEAGVAHGVDWRLLASIAFAESNFDATAVSWAGAVGLMQIRPKTAGRSADDLMNPEINSDAGAKHFRMLYDRYEHLDDETRLKFAIAAYNCGQGHLDDARILAIMRGKDPNRWEGHVDTALLLLGKPEYHRKVRYGYVRGSETVRYVDIVLRRYALFQRILDEAPPLRTAMRVDDPTESE